MFDYAHSTYAWREKSLFIILVDGIYEEWSQWSACSLTCGRGTRFRNRTCFGPYFDGAPCEGPSNESEYCFPSSCPGIPANLHCPSRTFFTVFLTLKLRNPFKIEHVYLNTMFPFVCFIVCGNWCSLTTHYNNENIQKYHYILFLLSMHLKKN